MWAKPRAPPPPRARVRGWVVVVSGRAVGVGADSLFVAGPTRKRVRRAASARRGTAGPGVWDGDRIVLGRRGGDTGRPDVGSSVGSSVPRSGDGLGKFRGELGGGSSTVELDVVVGARSSRSVGEVSPDALAVDQ